MKQTAVEWLEIQLFKKQGKFNKSDIEQAKAMEKEQIIEAFNQSWHDRMNPYKTADKYYTETYESND
jgi:hypothetical protein